MPDICYAFNIFYFCLNINTDVFFLEIIAENEEYQAIEKNSQIILSITKTCKFRLERFKILQSKTN